MKKITLIFALVFASTLLSAQGTILGFTVSPTNPTVNDQIKIFAELSFNSGACSLDFKDHIFQGNRINASAMHCIGMLTVICNTVDTFNLGQLSAGNKVFKLVLSSGSAPAPCSPGIVPDDNDSVSFVVSQPTSLTNSSKSKTHILISPNPFNDNATLTIINSESSFYSYTIELYDATGKLVRKINNITSKDVMIKRESLQNGIYFYKLKSTEGIVTTGKLILE